MKYMILVLLAVASLNAHAGREGHGGWGMQCKDPVTGKETVELYDLYEGSRLGLTYSHIENDQMGIEKVMGKRRLFLAPQEAENIKNALHLVDQRKFELKDKDDYLLKTADLNGVIGSKNCTPVQIGNFWWDGTLYIDPVYESQMDSLNRFAVKLHEAVYYLLRSFSKNVDDSNLVREYVRMILATGQSYNSRWDVLSAVPLEERLLQPIAFGELCSTARNVLERMIHCSHSFSQETGQVWHMAGMLSDRGWADVRSELVTPQGYHLVQIRTKAAGPGADSVCHTLRDASQKRDYRLASPFDLQEITLLTEREAKKIQKDFAFNMFQKPQVTSMDDYKVEGTPMYDWIEKNRRKGRHPVLKMDVNSYKNSVEIDVSWRHWRILPHSAICVSAAPVFN